MKKIKFFLAAALLFAAATISSSLLAQAGFYATVEKEGAEYVLYIKYHSTKPKTNSSILYVYPSDLETVAPGNESLAGYNYQAYITRAVIDVSRGFQPRTTKNWFRKMINLKRIEGMEYLYTGEVTDMSNMFFECKALTSVDVSWLDTRNVKDMSCMFQSCIKLKAIDFGEEYFKTTSLENANSVFNGCSSLKYVSLETWNFNKVTDVQEMFDGCKNLLLVLYHKDENIKLAKGAKTQYCCNAPCLIGYGSNYNDQYNPYSNKFERSNKFAAAKNGGLLTQTYQESSGKIQASYFDKKSITSLYELTTVTKVPYGGELDLSNIYINQQYTTNCYIKTKNEYYSLYVPLICLEGIAHKVKGFDNKKVGRQDVTVQYRNKTFSFYVDVQDTFKEYRVSTAPTKTEYTMPITVADIDISGMQIQKVMQSGSTSNVSMSGLQPRITGLNTTKTGSQTITLNFNIDGKVVTYSYTITVKDALKECKVTSVPIKKEYTMPFAVADLDLTGGVIKKVMYSGEIAHWSMGDFVYTVSGLDPKKAGEQEITLTFTLSDGTNFEWKYLINVIDVLKEVFVDAEPSRSRYSTILTADSLDLSGGEIKKVYYSDSTVEYAMGTMEFSVEGLDEVKAGENTLVLNFDLGDTNFAWEYKINVLEPTSADSTGSGDEPEKPVAVEDLNASGAAFEAWTSGGVLSVKAARGGVLEVLSVSGVLVRREELAAGSSLNLSLGKGVYVLRLDGEVKKVVVE